MGDGLQMLDMLVLLALAIFFISRLRKVLGKHIDDSSQNKPRTGRVVPLREGQDPLSAAAVSAAVHQVEDDAPLLADISDPDVTRALAEIKAADPAFNVREFLSGAKMAFEMILEAYNDGDRDQLRALLSKEVYTDFENAIQQRESAESHEESTLVAIESADIVRAALKGRTAEITVSFVSEQITVERDVQGNIVSGDPSVTELVTDEWTFARETRSNNPNWTLIGT